MYGWSRESGVVVYLLESVMVLPRLQYLFAVCSHYVGVFNITLLFCTGKVYSTIICKGFSGHDIVALLFLFMYSDPQKCGYEWIVIIITCNMLTGDPEYLNEKKLL
jgi:hypothetical protein